MNYVATVSRIGVWPSHACLQVLASNYFMLLRPNAVVVSDGEQADLIRQVSDEKVSASELLMTQPLRGSPGATKCVPVAVKTGYGMYSPDQCGRHLLTVLMAAGV